MTRQLRWILASLAISATAGAQAIPNTTSNGSASPATGTCPPGSINCIPGATQQSTTPAPFSPQPGVNQQLGPQPVIPPTPATPTTPTTPVPPQPGALPDTTSPGLGTSTLPGNPTSTPPGGTNPLPSSTLPATGPLNTPIVPNAAPPR